MKILNQTLCAASLLFGASAVLATPIALNPLAAGSYGSGNGVNSHWVQVDAEWRGAIHGTEIWGTGIWGLDDANRVLGLAAGDPHVVNTFNGVLSQIAWADKRYLDTWSPTWGAQGLIPFFSNDDAEYQDNFAVRFTGYIAITEAGLYNFGVLYDDGFTFSFFGDGSVLTLTKDGLNPRDRLGFDQDLELGVGLYAFELTAWERLEAGVVELSWLRPGGKWSLVPSQNFFTAIPPQAVSEPAVMALMLAGLGALARVRRSKPKA